MFIQFNEPGTKRTMTDTSGTGPLVPLDLFVSVLPVREGDSLA
jgi:hypothetical protein